MLKVGSDDHHVLKFEQIRVFAVFQKPDSIEKLSKVLFTEWMLRVRVGEWGRGRVGGE